MAMGRGREGRTGRPAHLGKGRVAEGRERSRSPKVQEGILGESGEERAKQEDGGSSGGIGIKNVRAGRGRLNYLLRRD